MFFTVSFFLFSTMCSFFFLYYQSSESRSWVFEGEKEEVRVKGQKTKERESGSEEPQSGSGSEAFLCVRCLCELRRCDMMSCHVI
jgi:hypothetical protein